MSAPLIENYRFKYKTRGKWIYVPNDRCLQRAKHIIRFFNRDVSFPDYFYHYRSGGHVAALHAHLKNDFFFKIDVRNFFYSIARNRVARAFAAKGLRGAPTYAKWSTWPAPGLDDTQLGESSLPLELHRAQIPDRRVPSL
jgi:hypothetical protein